MEMLKYRMQTISSCPIPLQRERGKKRTQLLFILTREDTQTVVGQLPVLSDTEPFEKQLAHGELQTQLSIFVKTQCP